MAHEIDAVDASSDALVERREEIFPPRLIFIKESEIREPHSCEGKEFSDESKVERHCDDILEKKKKLKSSTNRHKKVSSFALELHSYGSLVSEGSAFTLSPQQDVAPSLPPRQKYATDSFSFCEDDSILSTPSLNIAIGINTDLTSSYEDLENVLPTGLSKLISPIHRSTGGTKLESQFTKVRVGQDAVYPFTSMNNTSNGQRGTADEERSQSIGVVSDFNYERSIRVDETRDPIPSSSSTPEDCHSVYFIINDNETKLNHYEEIVPTDDGVEMILFEEDLFLFEHKER